MAKTKRETATRALRLIGVVAQDEAATADEYAVAEDTLDTLYAELNSAHGFSMTFGTDAIPDEYFLPMARLLGVEVARDFGVNAEPFATALNRLRAVEHVYTRDMDLDDDGTTTEVEISGFDAGGYY